MGYIESFEKYRELGNTSGLVREFLNELRNAGVEITPKRGNARILKKGGMSLGVLIHEYTPSDHKPPVWGIAKSRVDRMRKEPPRNWGVVCLRGQETFEFGFWVHGEHFDSLAEGPYTDKEGYESYRIHQRRLEETCYTQRFRTVEEFLKCVHI